MSVENPEDYVQAQREGMRIDRATALLPPYLINVPYFTEFVDAIDYVWKDAVDEPIRTMQNIRNMWVQNSTTEAKAQSDGMVAFSDWDSPDRELLVRQVNMLGLKLQSVGLISNTSLLAISRFVGQYWFGKGTADFIEFVNFCLGVNLQVVNLWTDDYVTFFEEGDVSIGTPVWEGGTWYPTTHVRIISNGGLQSLDPATLVTFFYEIANYNLVLESIDVQYDDIITTGPGGTDAEIVALGISIDAVITASNLYRYGVTSPPIVNVGGYLPTSYYSVSNTVPHVVLGEPTAWIVDDLQRKFPVYSTVDRNVTESSTWYNTFVSGLSTPYLPGSLEYSGLLTLLCDPDQWLLIPGASRSDGRIPGYAASPTRYTAQTSLPTQIMSRWRYNVLAAPAGFAQLTPGVYSPYWS